MNGAARPQAGASVVEPALDAIPTAPVQTGRPLRCSALLRWPAARGAVFSRHRTGAARSRAERSAFAGLTTRLQAGPARAAGERGAALLLGFGLRRLQCLAVPQIMRGGPMMVRCSASGAMDRIGMTRRASRTRGASMSSPRRVMRRLGQMTQPERLPGSRRLTHRTPPPSGRC